VLVIVGATGVGKTEVACHVAQEVGGEIVSADSRQMYRGMNIGTDKPGVAALDMAPHHLIDVIDPTEQFDAARFGAMARACFEEIASRGRVPMLVGGSGLYVKASLFGLFPSPPREENLRARLLAEEERRPGSLFKRLMQVDPGRATQLDPADRARVLRGVEFFELTGNKMSESLSEWTADSWPHVAVGLTRPRRDLYRRINGRVEEMLEKGFLEEVRSLLDGGTPPDSPGLQSIGYSEVVAHLAGELSKDETVALIQKNSRRYAKRQMTWFKRMSVTQWISFDDAASAAAQVVRLWREAILH
jgi:tRNA dimethylallyltransferase